MHVHAQNLEVLLYTLEGVTMMFTTRIKRALVCLEFK